MEVNLKLVGMYSLTKFFWGYTKHIFEDHFSNIYVIYI